MEELLDLAREVSQEAEVYWQEVEEDEATFENATLKEIESKSRSGFSLRLIKDGKLGFAYTRNILNPKDFLSSALRSLNAGVEVGYSFPLTKEVTKVESYSAKIEKLSSEKMVEEAERVIETLRSATTAQIDLVVGRATEKIRLINSAGTDLSSHFSYFYLAPFLLYPGTQAGLWRMFQAKEFIPYPEDYLHQLIRIYNLSAKEITPQGGQMKVLFLPEAMYVLLWRLRVGTSGESLYHQRSPLAGKIGEKILDEKLTIFEDPLDDNLPGARSFDDEGIPTKRFSLVEKGILNNFYCDFEYAAKLAKDPTGNGYRGREDPVTVEPASALWRLGISPGKASFDQMLSLMDRGLIIADALGAHSGNIPNGDFSIGASPGIYVENGEIRGRVKDVMVAGNIYDVMQHVLAIEDRLFFVGEGIYPAILFDWVNVSMG